MAATTATRAAAAAVGAGGVGLLLSSWLRGDTAPANLPSHPHHHHDYHTVAGMSNLKETDINHQAPRTVDSSTLGLVESWVGPAEPVNTTHRFDAPHPSGSLKTKLEIGVESRPSNSVFGLLNNWFGPVDASSAASQKH